MILNFSLNSYRDAIWAVQRSTERPIEHINAITAKQVAELVSRHILYIFKSNYAFKQRKLDNIFSMQQTYKHGLLEGIFSLFHGSPFNEHAMRFRKWRAHNWWRQPHSMPLIHPPFLQSTLMSHCCGSEMSNPTPAAFAAPTPTSNSTPTTQTIPRIVGIRHGPTIPQCRHGC